jgi:hypothetical protein
MEGPVGRPLTTADFDSIMAIRVRDDNDVIIHNMLPLVANAQAAAMVLDYSYSPNDNIPASFYRETSIGDADNREPFFVPVLQTRDDNRWFSKFIKEGYTSWPDETLQLMLQMNQPPDLYEGYSGLMNGIRNIGERVKFGGTGLSPVLMESLYEEIMWDILLQDKPEASEALLSIMVSQIPQTIYQASRASAADNTEKMIQEVSESYLESGQKKLAQKWAKTQAAYSEGMYVLGMAEFMAELAGDYTDVANECRSRWEKMPLALGYSEQLNKALLDLRFSNTGLSGTSPMLDKSIGLSSGYIIHTELPLLSQSFESYFACLL